MSGTPLTLTFPPGAALVAGCGNIGSAVARCLARAGVPVMVTYFENEPRAATLAAELSAQGAVAEARRCDFADSAAVRELLGAAAARFGRVQAVIYCSGPPIPFLTVRQMPPELLARHLECDTLGCFRLFHHALPLLAAGGGGSLTACVTMANQRTLETDGLSAMPKAAVESLVRQVAAEEAAHGIRANAVALGWVGGFADSFAAARSYTAAMSGPQAAPTRALMEHLMALIRMGRPGTPAEVAHIVAFLASQQASYVTGCLVPAAGGATL